MRKKIWLGISAVTLLAGLSVQAAADIRILSTKELSDVEYNGKVYEYVLEQSYETSDPDNQLTFEDVKGWSLQEVEYGVPEKIEETKLVTVTKMYNKLLEKKKSDIPETVAEKGVTYNLSDVKWSQEPNMEEVEYTVDYGYLTEEPKIQDIYEYTYTSPVTKKENTVNLPFVELLQGDKEWVDGFTANVTFHNIDGITFTLGNHTFDYNESGLKLTKEDFTELVKMLGYDTSKYRLDKIAWSGEAYKSKGQLNRTALATGQQYAASYKAVYRDTVENGNIYTAAATYEAEVLDESIKTVYRITATGYYEKASIPVLGIVIMVVLAVGILYIVAGKKKKVSMALISTENQEYRG